MYSQLSTLYTGIKGKVYQLRTMEIRAALLTKTMAHIVYQLIVLFCNDLYLISSHFGSTDQKIIGLLFERPYSMIGLNLMYASFT